MNNVYAPKTAHQKFLNGEVHNWYRLVLGYSDHLVGQLLNDFGIEKGQKVIDPFCGTGTTLIECMKRGIDCVGIDANPSSVFASCVKTNWRLKSRRLEELLTELEKHKRTLTKAEFQNEPTFQYLERTGMLKRGWISLEPLRKAIAVKIMISELPTNKAYKNLLLLTLIAEVINGASNVRFGPELYCGPPKEDADVFSGFATRVRNVCKDLDAVSTLLSGQATVFWGDARESAELLQNTAPGPYDAVICSPPYPVEHDYTRNARLELAFLELVSDRLSLQSIKKRMIRSHTKGIYKGDNDSSFVFKNPKIDLIVKKLSRKTKNRKDGFARLYPTVVREYFGGMKRHLINIKTYLHPRAFCAYVVGDQSSYLRVHIPTAKILAFIAEEVGFEIVEIKHWRSRWSSVTSKQIDENILILRNRNSR